MSITVNKNIARGLNILGYWVGTFFSVVPDNSYPTGGYAFAAGLIKLGFLEYMAPILCMNSAYTAAIIGVYNPTTLKLQFFWVSAGALGSPTLNIIGGQAAGIALQVTPDTSSGVIGKTTAGDIAIPITLTGLGGLTEVASLTDLSDYTGIGVAYGRG